MGVQQGLTTGTLSAKEVHDMTKPDTPFPGHWLYYIISKYVVLVTAVAITFYIVYRLVTT
jgi:hypothetical protein